MTKGPIDHLRKPHPFPVSDHWRLGCSCGWQGKVERCQGPRQLGRDEAEAKLNKQFIDHIPADRRQLYVLVDQRPSHLSAEDPEGNPIELPTGNFIMPEGVPCSVLSWRDEGGTYFVEVRGFGLRDRKIELPVGEIRTAEGRVFRMA